MYGLFMKIALAILQPSDHPLVDGFPAHQGSPVRARSNEEGYLVLGCIDGIPVSSFFINQPAPGGRKIVTLSCLNEPGRRRREFHIIRYIKPARKKMRKAHFSVGVRAGEQ